MVKGKRGAKKASMPRPRPRPRMRRNATSEWASASQTLLTPNDSIGTIYQFDTLKLSDWDRLYSIAKGYQYFRFTSVELRFKPLADTFITGSGNGIPYFYWLINKGENNTIGTFNAMRDAGSKPIRFDDKTLVVKYKPAVLQYLRDVENGTGVRVSNFTLSRTAPWLSTNNNAGLGGQLWTPNEVEHCGVLYGVDALGNVGQAYQMEVTVHAQFKKPLNFPGGSGENIQAPVRKEVHPSPAAEKPVV